MNNISDRISSLSPEKRKLLEALMQKQGHEHLRMRVPYVQPNTETEKILVNIWEEVLGVKQVGINDSFHELGGDSIQSIQIVARARQAGLLITTQQLFDNPTIAALAAVSKELSSISREQNLLTGTLPLLPIQRWFFELNLPQSFHWNQALLLELKRRVPASYIELSIGAMVQHHDTLRIRFKREENGWQQYYAPIDRPSFCHYEFGSLPDNFLEDQIQKIIDDTQRSLSIEEGPLFKAILFDCGEDRPQRLLIVAHHLIVDGVSFRVLLEDLQRCCEQLAHGSNLQFPPKSTSLQEWSEAIKTEANSASIAEDAAYWLSIGESKFNLPLDFSSGDNSEASASSVTISLNEEDTNALLRSAPIILRAQINEILLAALLLVISRWSGSRSILLDVEGHGRDESLASGLDLSRTVGWMTSLFPVELKIERLGTLVQVLTEVKKQWRRIPKNGLPYSLARYCNDDTKLIDRLNHIQPREIMFNYLGQFDYSISNSNWFSILSEFCHPLYGEKNPRPHKLQIYGGIVDNRLKLYWTYSRNLHHEETIRRLAIEVEREIKGLVQYTNVTKNASLSEADFPDAELAQGDLQKILSYNP
jgi:non-ribosomal peptide synthase protein (TIGR01720 family)